MNKLGKPVQMQLKIQLRCQLDNQLYVQLRNHQLDTQLWDKLGQSLDWRLSQLYNRLHFQLKNPNE